MNVVTLHRSRRAVVVLAARAVLLPVGVAVLGQNLATIHQWSPRTWAVSVAVALCAVAAFVELVRSFATTDLTIVDGDLVLRSPTLLRRPVRIAHHQIVDARVTPHGWFDYSGRMPYSARDTAVITSERPDLGASIRAVVTLDAPVALPWLRIPTPFGDLTRGRAMPRAARRLVLSMATRDLAAVHELWYDLPHADIVPARAARDVRRRDASVACTRIALVAAAAAAFAVLPHATPDPLHALRPGACLDAPGTTAPTDLTVESCSLPHTAEVVGTTSDAGVASIGAGDCASQYDIYAGSVAHSGVRVQVLRERGSNKGVCIAVLPTFVNYSLRDDGTAI